LAINLCLAFFEQPSSFSRTSDVRDQAERIRFPQGLLMFLEGFTLIWFFTYISAKVETNRDEMLLILIIN